MTTNSNKVLSKKQSEMVNTHLQMDRKHTADPTQRPNLDNHVDYDETMPDPVYEIKEEISKNHNQSDDESADLERASGNEDILDSHISRGDRAKIKELFDKVNEQNHSQDDKAAQEVNEVEEDEENDHSRHPMFKNPTQSDGSGTLDRYSGTDHEQVVEKVEVVKTNQILPYAKVILDF